jgi:transcriptional regulator with XRE-family HTH domain
MVTELGDLIRRYCAEHHLSRLELANRCHLSEGTIRNLETGRDKNTGLPYKPKPVTLHKLSKGTGITYETLMRVAGLLPMSGEESDTTILQILETVRQLDNDYKKLVLSIVRTIRREQDRLEKKRG